MGVGSTLSDEFFDDWSRRIQGDPCMLEATIRYFKVDPEGLREVTRREFIANSHRDNGYYLETKYGTATGAAAPAARDRVDIGSVQCWACYTHEYGMGHTCKR